jgi:hypothetical protein
MTTPLKQKKKKYVPPTIAKFDLTSQKPFVTAGCKNFEGFGEGNDGCVTGLPDPPSCPDPFNS